MTDDDTVQHHGCNHDGRDFIVGDIHGYLRQLEGLLAHVGFDRSRDRLFSVGDLIDRGPDSAAALQLVDAPWCFAVRGNHEQMMLDAHAANAPANAEALWLSNGGAWSRQLDTQALTAHRQRAASLPLAMTITIETGARVGLVHADIGMADWADFVTRLGEAPIKDTALWSRHTLSALGRPGARRNTSLARVTGIDVIFHGHTPLAAPLAVANRRWLDTGVFTADGALTLAELLPDGRLWSIDRSGQVRETAWTAG
ncbi:metallophosphoesterase [Salinisphaera japonica]|uniref:Metallophosphoesterase n=1 Tax=Salinisphaera japonica YTM-1 TaxID=1209778 RepID=A0A423PW21_9GAMM|nr:metallophosphoesterase [Salinisphaera japonica]ROO29808.1 metallophosphoesterase [Salinisphaera japonica YTM-1]